MAFKTKSLRDLGAISGRGVVKQNGEAIAPAKIRSRRLFIVRRKASQVAAKSNRCAEVFERP